MKHRRAVLVVLATALPCAASAEKPPHVVARGHELAKGFNRGESPFIEFPRPAQSAFPAYPATVHRPPARSHGPAFPGRDRAQEASVPERVVPFSGGERSASESGLARIPECK